MINFKSLVYFILLYSLVSTSTGCNDPQFVSSQLKTDKISPSDSSTTAPSDENKDESTASKPAEPASDISGAYLTCGQASSQDLATDETISNDQNTNAMFGCALLYVQTKQKKPAENWRISLETEKGDKSEISDLKRAAEQSPWQVVFAIPAQLLKTTFKIVANVKNNETAEEEIQEFINPDQTPPPALANFSAMTGSGQTGGIILNLALPNDISDYDKMSIRFLNGNVPPNEDCASDGEILKEITINNIDHSAGQQLPPLLHQTTLYDGQYFSYRVCILDKSGNLTSQNTALAKTFDSTAPIALAGFNVTAGEKHDSINISITLPQETSDYAQLKVMLGNDCTSGRSIYETIDFSKNINISSLVIDAEPLPNPPVPNNYIACIWDGTGNVTSTNTISGVTATDKMPPHTMSSIFATTGTADHSVNLTWTYPNDTSDFDHIKIVRKKNPNSSSITCDDEVVSSITDLKTTSLADTNIAPWTPYIYGVCAYDKVENLSTIIAAATYSSGAPVQQYRIILTSLSGLSYSYPYYYDFAIIEEIKLKFNGAFQTNYASGNTIYAGGNTFEISTNSEYPDSRCSINKAFDNIYVTSTEENISYISGTGNFNSSSPFNAINPVIINIAFNNNNNVRLQGIKLYDYVGGSFSPFSIVDEYYVQFFDTNDQTWKTIPNVNSVTRSSSPEYVQYYDGYYYDNYSSLDFY